MMNLCKRAQGATEYLVLLGVVLIIAMVAIVLLNFFAGTSEDAAATETLALWQSQSPIAIIEIAGAYGCNGYFCFTNVDSGLYMRIRNTGSYPLKITKLIGSTGQSADYTWYIYPSGGGYSAEMDSVMPLIQPGEEMCIGPGIQIYSSCRYNFVFRPKPYNSNNQYLGGVQSVCSSSGKGRLTVAPFGFEYQIIAGGNAVTKRQVLSKGISTKCIGFCDGSNCFVS